ncbi:type IV toxin-antitoxin system AbiEi family antitoxin domain-containing protein [Tsukamurella spumae]
MRPAEPHGPLVRPIDMWEDAALLFAAQDGVASLAQLRSAGVSPAMIAVRIESGELVRIARGLFRTKHHPHTDRTGIRIGVALAGGVADRGTALFWHRMIDEVPASISVTVGPERRLRASAGYRVETRRRTLDPADVVEVDGLAVTGKPLSVLEVADARIMDRALQRGNVTLDDLQAALDRNARARGILTARTIFDVAAGDTESEAERLFAALLRLHGMTGWHTQLGFRGWAIDFAFPEFKVAVEINGWAFHRSRARWQSDQDKANALTIAGWSVLNFSWHHLTDDPEGVITTLAEAIGARAA